MVVGFPVVHIFFCRTQPNHNSGSNYETQLLISLINPPYLHCLLRTWKQLYHKHIFQQCVCSSNMVGWHVMLKEVLLLMYLSGFSLHTFGLIVYYSCMPHVMGGDLNFFCTIYPLKLYHEFIVESYPILMEQNLRKFSLGFKVAVFPMFFI